MTMKLYEPTIEVPKGILYTCPICRHSYDDEKSAQECLNRGRGTGGWKIGDIVVIPGRWTGWYGGDKRWIACIVPPNMSSDDHCDHIPHVNGWYVVTNITLDCYHSVCLHVATRYVEDDPEQENGVYGGHTTFTRSHYTPYRPLELPEDVRKSWRLPVIGMPPDDVMQEMQALAARRLTYMNLLE